MDNYGPSSASYPQAVEKPCVRRCGRLGTTVRLSTDHHQPVYGLLKVLGMTAMVILTAVHRLGEKVGGLPVDNRWTTVDNLSRVDDCGRSPGFVPWFSTCESPVDNQLACANKSSPHFAQDR